MSKLMLFVTCSLSLLLAGCGPKVTQCTIIYDLALAYCHNLSSDKKDDRPLASLDPVGTQKWQCLSPDDLAEMERGNFSNLTVCTIISVEDDTAYCNAVDGKKDVSIRELNKFACFTNDDLSELARYISKKKN